MTGYIQHSFVNGAGIVSYITCGFYLGRLIFSLSGGWCCDRWGRGPVLVVGFALASIGMLLASLLAHEVVLFFASFTLGGIVGIVPVSVMAMIGNSVPPERRYLAFGSVYLWGNLGIGLVIVFAQYLAQFAGNFRVCFAVFTLLYALCALLVRSVVK
jgi:MFS family permease